MGSIIALLQSLLAAIPFFDKWFTKAPSKKIAKRKKSARKKVDKFKKTGRPKK